MQKLLSVISLSLLLTACATKIDPTLEPGVKRQGGGLYSISEMNMLAGDPASKAVKQCQLDGNKKLDIFGTTTQNGMYSGTTYAVLLFRCE